MTKEKIWTSTFTLTVLISLLCYTAFYLLTVIMETVAVDQFHTSASMGGILSGIFVVGGFAGRLFAGSKIVGFGIRRMLMLGAIFYLLMTLLYFVTPNLMLLIFLRFFHGVGFGIVATAASTLAGYIVPLSRRGEGIGYFALSITIASAFGPFLSIFLYHAINYAALLVLATSLNLVTLLAIFFLKIPQNLAEPRKLPKRKFSLNHFFERTAMPISLIGFLVGLAYAGILSFLANFSASVGLVTAGSLFYVVYAIFIVASRPVTGRLFDAKGDNFVLIPTFLFFAAGLALTGWSTSTFMLLLAAVFVGLGYGSFLPFGQAIAIRRATPERIGIATSTIYGIFDMGVGIGPFLLGMILPATGYRNLYYISAVFLLLVLALYWLIHGRKAPKA